MQYKQKPESFLSLSGIAVVSQRRRRWNTICSLVMANEPSRSASFLSYCHLLIQNPRRSLKSKNLKHLSPRPSFFLRMWEALDENLKGFFNRETADLPEVTQGWREPMLKVNMSFLYIYIYIYSTFSAKHYQHCTSECVSSFKEQLMCPNQKVHVFFKQKFFAAFILCL